MAPELNNDEKLPKKTDHSIAIYSFFCIGNRYGIFKMPPGESSCPGPGGSEYVWQRGEDCRGYFRPNMGGQSLPYFPKKKRSIFEPLKKSISPKIFKFELTNFNHFFP